MTMTLHLSEEQERALRAAADEQKGSPEDVVMLLVDTLVKSGASKGQAETAETAEAEEFSAIVEGVLRDNAELYRRLA